jgi:alginate O-acetyltransferase complex protein AlgI
MIFNTWVFGLFAVATVVLYWSAVPQRWKPYALVILGSIFYVYSVPAYLVLIFGLATITFVVGRLMLRPDVSPHGRKNLLAVGVVLIAGTLLFFKYTKLFVATIDQVAHHNILPIPNIVVPLAISFFTFEFVHVLVDVYLGKIIALPLLEFAVFSMFFPTLVAGPIKRFQSFAPQVREIAMPPTPTFMLNIYRIVMGLAKKTIIADSMTVFIQPILGRFLRLRRQDLFRLQRILRHRDRRSRLARPSHPGELRDAVPDAEHRAVLAALAHFALELDPRLHLHPARG